MACPGCTERLRNSIPKDSHSAFMRALAFGAAAAFAGLAVYAVVGIATGLEIGYVSLAVGWLVGKAMMKGSGGLGGRRYQISAVLFTYAAVSMAAIPIGISEYVKSKKTDSQNQSQQSTSPKTESQPSGNQADTETRPLNQDQGSKPGKSMASALGYLALLGLASPFLDFGSNPVSGVIGLVILLVGIQIAWQITRGHPPLDIDGPF
ncbi:MAG TPA: hypothetical protein VG498_04655 [Terriglobales bacterium]|nr:hypothetical protein [Terriglobales bacterium]